MTDKITHFTEVLQRSPVELRFASPDAARRYRLSLYHFRRVAALQDPRALRVKISLQGLSVTLHYDPDSHPIEEPVRATV